VVDVPDVADEAPSTVLAQETPSPVPVRQRLPPGAALSDPSAVERPSADSPPTPVPVVEAPHQHGPLARAAPVEPQQDEPVVEPVVERPLPGPASTRSLTWARLGDGPTREFIARNGAALAEKVQQLAHPTGKKAGLLGFELRGEGDLTAVELQVAWSGRVAGSAYQTTVIWEFSRVQHVRLVVVSDTEGTIVPAERVAALDAYFRDTVFPVLPR
jgi:hypothetical protein